MNRTNRSRQPDKVKKTVLRNPNPVGGIIIAMLAFAMIYVIIAGISVAPKANIAVGEIAKETIKATRQIIDRVNTEAERQKAQDTVSPMYKLDNSITDSTMEDVALCFEKMEEVRGMWAVEKQRLEKEKEDSGEQTIKYSQSFLNECLAVLPDGFAIGNIMYIVQMPEEEFRLMNEVITDLIRSSMDSGIKQDVLSTRKFELNQIFFDNEGFSEYGNQLGPIIISQYLNANLIYDSMATETARDLAEQQVDPIIYKQGETIVEDGAEVDEAQYAVLKELGLVEDNNSGWMEYVSIATILLLLYVVGIVYIRSFQQQILYSNKLIAVILMVTVLTIVFTWACTILNEYIVPVAYAPLIFVLIMLDKKVALFLNVILSLLVGVMSIRFGDNTVLPVTIAAFLGGTVSVFTIRNASQRASLMVSGIISGFVMAAVYVVFDLIAYAEWLEMLLHGGMGLASGLLTAILAIGTLPIWESLFKLVTPMKLMELTNPNQPLLKKLLMEAPGSYHHSIMVGNMGERAAEAVGANSLVVRAGAYYHDIGKTKRPYFFVENQTGKENPHDNIDPELSTRIITSHVTEGLDMVRKAKLPQVIQDIVGQHHGDTAVKYFYYKQRERSSSPDTVKMDHFRYPGIRPHSKEAAIVMLADSCEAAVRSIDEPDRDNVSEMINKVFKDKLDDGQLNFCDITMRELSMIKREFMTALTGIFHDRIEYPDK